MVKIVDYFRVRGRGQLERDDTSTRFETRFSPRGDWPLADESLGSKEVYSDAKGAAYQELVGVNPRGGLRTLDRRKTFCIGGSDDGGGLSFSRKKELELVILQESRDNLVAPAENAENEQSVDLADLPANYVFDNRFIAKRVCGTCINAGCFTRI